MRRRRSNTGGPPEARRRKLPAVRPRVSVIVPVYRVEATIAEAVGSAIRQTLRELELIVVDDGSDDDSVAIVRAFDDPRVRVITQENRGLSGARNTGIRAATAEYVAFLDGDDVWAPNKLELQVAHLDRDPGAGVSFCRAELIAAGGARLGVYQMPRLTALGPGEVLCNTPIKNGSTPVARKVALEEAALERPGGAQYFDESLRSLEDVECWVRLLLRTRWRLEGLPELLVGYRTSARGLTSDPARGLRDFDQLLDHVRAYAPEFVDTWAGPALGYQLRYRAQRALLVGDEPTRAARLMVRALQRHPRMLAEDPGKTALTTGAALARALLPEGLYHRAERAAFRGAGALQRLGLLQD